jgi:hypothetical protein
MLLNRTPATMAEEWLAAKADENNALVKRVEIEDELIASLGESEEGATTIAFDAYKVTITSKITRKVDDPDAYSAIVEELEDTNLNPVSIVESYKISDAKCRELRLKEPDIYAKLSYAISAKKAKSAVKIERIEL